MTERETRPGATVKVSPFVWRKMLDEAVDIAAHAERLTNRPPETTRGPIEAAAAMRLAARLSTLGGWIHARSEGRDSDARAVIDRRGFYETHPVETGAGADLADLSRRTDRLYERARRLHDAEHHAEI